HWHPLTGSTNGTALLSTSRWRLGKPEDIANGVLFFVSERSWVTGQTISIDGGHALLMTQATQAIWPNSPSSSPCPASAATRTAARGGRHGRQPAARAVGDPGQPAPPGWNGRRRGLLRRHSRADLRAAPRAHRCLF